MPFTLFATGVNSAGAPTTGTDSHYSIISAPAPAPTGPANISTAIPGTWAANNATSKWISPQNGNTNVAPGSWTYRTTFDLTGLVPSTANIVGTWAADNSGLILLNGVSTGNTVAGFTVASIRSFRITSGFRSGINTLDFVVTNAGSSANPSGLRVLSIAGNADAVPEIDPSSSALPLALTVGLLLLVGERRLRPMDLRPPPP